MRPTPITDPESPPGGPHPPCRFMSSTQRCPQPRRARGNAHFTLEAGGAGRAASGENARVAVWCSPISAYALWRVHRSRLVLAPRGGSNFYSILLFGGSDFFSDLARRARGNSYLIGRRFPSRATARRDACVQEEHASPTKRALSVPPPSPRETSRVRQWGVGAWKVRRARTGARSPTAAALHPPPPPPPPPLPPPHRMAHFLPFLALPTAACGLEPGSFRISRTSCARAPRCNRTVARQRRGTS